MAVKDLKSLINKKAELKEGFIKDLRESSIALSSVYALSLLDVYNKLFDTLHVSDEGIIKDDRHNRSIISTSKREVKRIFSRHNNDVIDSLDNIGSSTLDLHKELKSMDASYLGDEAVAYNFVNQGLLPGILDIKDTNANRISNTFKSGGAFVGTILTSAFLYRTDINGFRNRLINTNGIPYISDSSSVYSSTLGAMNGFSGDLLSFYTEQTYTSDEGYKLVFNSNPMDERTKPICAMATLAGVIPVNEMSGTYGMPPRMLCRCDIVWLQSEWKNAIEDVNSLIDTQRNEWRRVLISAPRRKDGKFYSKIEEQLSVLGNVPVNKFERNSLNTNRLRVMSKNDFDKLVSEYKSSYKMMGYA